MRPGPFPCTLRQLQYAVAVADTLSFRRAAERCRVAQPSLSAQLALLEEALGVQLFERDRRRVLVTGAGREILDRARRVLLAAEDLVQSGQRAGDPLAGTIRVGVIPTISPYLLPAITPALRQQFPRLRLAWREDHTDQLVKLLHRGELDAALVALEAELGSVDRAVIADDRFVLAMRADHPLAANVRPLALAELRGAEVMLLDDGHCFRSQALELCATVRAREAEFRATSLATLVQMVAGGGGVTLLPSLAVAAEAGRAGLKVRPLSSPGAHRTLALVWRKHAPLASTLRQLAAVMRLAYPAPSLPAPGKRRSTRR